MLENTFQHISLTTEWGMGMVNGFNGISNDNAYQSITLMVFLIGTFWRRNESN